MKGGFLLAMLGAWIVTQVIGGEALQRLGVLPLGGVKHIADTAAPAQGYAGAAAAAGVAAATANAARPS